MLKWSPHFYIVPYCGLIKQNIFLTAQFFLKFFIFYFLICNLWMTISGFYRFSCFFYYFFAKLWLCAFNILTIYQWQKNISKNLNKIKLKNVTVLNFILNLSLKWKWNSKRCHQNILIKLTSLTHSLLLEY